MTAAEIVEAARALAWWTHSNLSSPDLYAARRGSFTRLRAALAEAVTVDGPIELALVIRAARRLAACSDSNRWGEPYYERKEAFAQLRGALAVLDGAPPLGVNGSVAERGERAARASRGPIAPDLDQATSSLPGRRASRSIHLPVLAR